MYNENSDFVGVSISTLGSMCKTGNMLDLESALQWAAKQMMDTDGDGTMSVTITRIDPPENRSGLL